MVEICVLQGTVATFFGCGGQERDLLHEFFTDSVHHKSFVWLIFDRSYSKNTRWTFFGTQCISPVCVDSLIVCMYADSEVCCSGQRTLLILHCDTTTTTTSTVITMG